MLFGAKKIDKSFVKLSPAPKHCANVFAHTFMVIFYEQPIENKLEWPLNIWPMHGVPKCQNCIITFNVKVWHICCKRCHQIWRRLSGQVGRASACHTAGHGLMLLPCNWICDSVVWQGTLTCGLCWLRMTSCHKPVVRICRSHLALGYQRRHLPHPSL